MPAHGSKVLAPDHGFNSERSKQSENGGRGTHTELGIAIADAILRGHKRVLVVGLLTGADGLECAFYRCAVVERLNSIHDLLQALLLERGAL